MAFKWASLFAFACLAVAVYAEGHGENTYEWAEVSAAVGGCVGIMMLMVGIFFVIYDFTCRNYFTGKAGAFFRMDAEVAAGSSTKL
jgi:hypothetical protein